MALSSSRFRSAALLLCVLALRAQAHEIKISAFNVNSALVANPKSRLVQGSDGAFYGTSFQGGNEGTASGGFGYIFRVTAQGSGSDIYDFTNGADGDSPSIGGGLSLGPDGLLYGASQNGTIGPNGADGVIYTVTPAGDLTPIFTFAIDDSQGKNPNGGLVYDPTTDTLYGTTAAGGTYNNGVIFSISPDGSNFKVLHIFSKTFGILESNSDGARPASGLTIGDDGVLYGVTPDGGANGNGVIYSITAGGSFNPIYSFSATNSGVNIDGANPTGELAKAANGIFYGVAMGGGDSSDGTIFKFNSATNAVTTFYHFIGGSNGAFPNDILLLPGGSLWGTTSGGSDGGGTVFGVFPNHTDTNVSFPGGNINNGDGIDSGLVLGSDGNLYGVTDQDGPDSNGTFFEVVLNSHTIEPFAAQAGRYFGLLTDGVNTVGTVSIDFTAGGIVTAKTENGVSSTFHGPLGNGGAFSETLRNGHVLALQLSGDSGGFIFTGKVGEATTFTAYRSAFDAGESPTNAGYYTAGIYNNSGTAIPQGYAAATMTVSKAGIVSLTGKLVDGSPLRASGLLLQGSSGYDQFLFFNNTSLFGELGFQPVANNWDAEGAIDWTVAPNKDRYFPSGFTANLGIQASLYTPPARGQPALSISNGTITIDDGGLTSSLVDNITINDNNTVTVSGPIDQLKIKIDAAKGTFTGSFVGPASPRTTDFGGILFYNGTYQVGFAGFLGPVSATPDPSGQVRISP
jgi:uncharacterized repeat protein (TIGR03803 family)